MIDDEVKVSDSRSKTRIAPRGNAGFSATITSVRDLSVSFQMLYDPADTNINLFEKAWNNNTSVAVAVLSNDKSVIGTTGYWADWEITQFDKSEPIDGAQTVSITLDTALTAVPPEKCKVSS